jgi:hypothetical protein
VIGITVCRFSRADLTLLGTSRREPELHVSAANSPAVDTARFSEMIPEAGNGTSPIARDIADIALQQLLDREIQDS